MSAQPFRRFYLLLAVFLAISTTANAQTTASASVDGVTADLTLESLVTETTASLDAQASVEVTAPPASFDSDVAGTIFLEALGLDLVDIDTVSVEADVDAPTPTSAELQILNAVLLGDGPATVSIDQLTANVDITGSCTTSLSFDVQVDLQNAVVDAGLLGSTNISGSAAANATVYNDLGVEVTLNEQVVVEGADFLDITVRPVVVRVGGAVASLVTIDGRVQLGEIRVRVDCDQTSATSDLELTQSGAPSLVTPGQNIDFDVILTNLGPDAAPSAQVTFDLPPELENAQLSPSSGTCSAGSCQITDLGNGSAVTIGVSGTIGQDASGVMAWSASASTPNQDPDTSNDTVETIMAVDRDGDSVADGQDNCPDVPNSDQSDLDGDGTGDACDNGGTEDPGPDTDADGIQDADDNCPLTPNPDQADLDGDGVGDACDATVDPPGDVDSDQDGIPDDQDNCPDVPNPDQGDLDGDGVGNACDNSNTEGPGPDTDADGIPDADDNCPFTPNPDQTDSDGNGVGDACQSSDPDTDGDGVPDSDDNCPVTFNPSQTDVDGDGIGDACDPEDNSDPNEPRDTDEDGIPDDEDNCPTTPNPAQTDADGDGIGDACDETPNPGGPDIDGDGIPDADDNCYRHFNPDQADADGDGLGDECDTTFGDGGEAACSQIFQGTELLLHDGRFRVTARWATPLESGFGDAVRLTKDSGYFTFFDEANIELVVKVLDACVINQRFWVSVAGLTDVEVDVVVVDTVTGATWRYSNDMKNIFDTTIDVGALVVCQ